MIHRGGDQISQERLIILDGHQWYVELLLLRLLCIHSYKMTETAHQTCSEEKVFWKYAANLQENKTKQLYWNRSPLVWRAASEMTTKEVFDLL